MNNAELIVSVGVLLGALGVAVESLIFREPRSLWSAHVYLSVLRSRVSLIRGYAQTRGHLSRREQLLMSFITFFLIGFLCALVFLTLR